MNNSSSKSSLEQQVANLPKEITPQRDLWRGIENAIAITPQQHDSKKRPLAPVAWAASVVVAILVSWLSFNLPPSESTNQMTLASGMQQDFEQQKQSMLVSLGQPKLEKLPAEMQAQLADLASARNAISKALENDPNNSELLNLLSWTQKQELELLKQLYSPKWQTI